MVTTKLDRGDGQILTHTGDIGITLTAQRVNDGIQAFFEIWPDIPEDECVALVGTFLTFLEEKLGAAFVTQIIAHYADETGKVVSERPNGRKMFILRGK